MTHQGLAHQNRQRGFTLMEATLAVLGMGVVLAAGMVAHNPLATQSSAAEATFMDSITASLFKYAKRNNRLPCPDTDNDGFENATAGVCTSAGTTSGKVPYLTLEMTLSGPVGTGMDQQFTFGVYRGGGVATKDLTVNAERSMAAAVSTPHVAPNASYKNLDDFKQAVINAGTAASTSTEIYVTGNDASSADSDCSVVANMAFIVAFSGSRHAAVNSGKCFTGPGKPFSPTYDNLVRAVGFAELNGVLSR
jgi:Tfp pilus assembly protein PilE